MKGNYLIEELAGGGGAVTNDDTPTGFALGQPGGGILYIHASDRIIPMGTMPTINFQGQSGFVLPFYNDGGPGGEKKLDLSGMVLMHSPQEGLEAQQWWSVTTEWG